MSQTVITKAFAEWKAQQAIDNKAVVLDEFVFAFIPGQDPNQPIPNTDGLPDADKIVYRQPVSKSGVVNLNAVVYSVVLGTEVGDFDFNWIGLINKATGTVGAITHAPTQRKVKNASGQQGNTLTRSILMEYAGAQVETQITVPAATWQIDFTARLAGMDEALRLANADIYGAGAFFDTGFLASKNGPQFFVTKGVGYVGGLRASLGANQNITVTSKPTKVWVDVCFTGTVTSVFQTAITFTVAPTLANYVTNGVAHYVFALASIDAAGVITDLRPKGSSQYLRKDQNLTDIADPNLALNTLNGVPKTRRVNNKALSDDIDLTPADVGALPSGGTAVAATKLATPRKIAGVEFDGTQDINLTPENVGALPSGGTAAAATKLATARKIAGVSFDGSKDIAITSGDVGAVQQGGGVGMSTNKVILGWDGAKLRAQVDSTSMGALYCEKNKPTAQDIGALPLSGGDLKGSVTTTGEISAKGDIHSDSNIHSFGTIQAAKGVYDSPGVRAYSSNNKPLPKDLGAIERDGCSVAGFVGGNGSAPYMRYAASDTVVELAPRDWVNGNFIQRDGCRAAGFVGGNGADPYMLYTASNTVVQLATRDLVNQNFLTSISRGAQASMVMDGQMVEAPSGCVLTGGNGNEGNMIGVALYRPLQMRRNGVWLIIEG